MSHFDQEIQVLKDRLLSMASRAESSVRNAIRALVERDDELARGVKGNDDQIDQLEKEIDE